MNCEDLRKGLQARAFRHRPGFERAVHFQPEVVVQPRGVVPLDAEVVAARRSRRRWLGFRSFVERPLALVFLQRRSGTMAAYSRPELNAQAMDVYAESNAAHEHRKSYTLPQRSIAASAPRMRGRPNERRAKRPRRIQADEGCRRTMLDRGSWLRVRRISGSARSDIALEQPGGGLGRPAPASRGPGLQSGQKNRAAPERPQG